MAMSNHSKLNVTLFVTFTEYAVSFLFVNEKPLTIQNKNHLLKQHGPQTALTLIFANLKDCCPNGIPMIVRQSNKPLIQCPIANGSPLIISQIIFTTKDTPLSLYTTRFLNGQKLNPANLKTL